jgi:hypothetical protein
MNADPQSQLLSIVFQEFCTQFLHAQLNFEGAIASPLSCIFSRDRSTEECHYSIAGEVANGAPMMLDNAFLRSSEAANEIVGCLLTQAL